MLKRNALLALLLTAGLSVGAPAAAQTDVVDPTQQQAREQFETGRLAAEGERWTEALEAFRSSYALYARPQTLYNVASALARLGRAHEAIVALDEILALPTGDEAAIALHASADTLRAAVAASLRTVVVHVTPAEAALEIDGVAVEGIGPERALTLDPGEHQLTASAPRHSPARSTLGPELAEISVALELLAGELEIVSDVEDASLSVDGRVVGRGHVELTVESGLHRVDAEAVEHEPFTTTIEVPAGERVSVQAVLPAIPRPRELSEDPIFWTVLGGSVVVVGLAIGLGVGLSQTAAPYGGTTGVVFQPLLAR